MCDNVPNNPGKDTGFFILLKNLFYTEVGKYLSLLIGFIVGYHLSIYISDVFYRGFFDLKK